MTDSITNWGALAERLLVQALTKLNNDEDDALVAVDAARAALRAWAGEVPEAEFRDLLCALDQPGEPTEDAGDAIPCTCPPGLAARGGWRSSCPAHGTG
jgi:hypothetical protein